MAAQQKCLNSLSSRFAKMDLSTIRAKSLSRCLVQTLSLLLVCTVSQPFVLYTESKPPMEKIRTLLNE